MHYKNLQDGRVAFCINGRNENHSNWMRYLNCVRIEDEQNMIAIQIHGNIYYRIYKDVEPGKELLVWYGEEMALPWAIMMAKVKARTKIMVRNNKIDSHRLIEIRRLRGERDSYKNDLVQSRQDNLLLRETNKTLASENRILKESIKVISIS